MGGLALLAGQLFTCWVPVRLVDQGWLGDMVLARGLNASVDSRMLFSTVLGDVCGDVVKVGFRRSSISAKGHSNECSVSPGNHCRVG